MYQFLEFLLGSLGIERNKRYKAAANVLKQVLL